MILVTGAGGQVGTELLARAARHGHQVRGLARADLDIADKAAVNAAVAEAGAGGASLIVNAAAYTAVDRAEEEPEAARAINCDGPAHLAAAAKAAGIPLLHISTDYVFDGTGNNGAWTERDPVAPLGVYGMTKEAGERAVRENLPEHIILRTSWVYAAHGGNFLKTMLRVGAERDELRVVADQFGAPTFAGDIADAILTIATRLRDGKQDGGRDGLPGNLWGTYHFTAEGLTSWHGFADAIFARAEGHWQRRPVVTAIPSHEYPTPARRPENSMLDCTAILAAFAVPRRPWQDGMNEVLDILLAGK